jgi:hypothetical protein
VIRVQVLNWEQYLGRKGVDNPRWFSFQKALMADPRYMGQFSADMVATLCYVVCHALGHENGYAEINPAHAQAYIGLNAQQLSAALEKLQRIQFVHTDEQPCTPLYIDVRAGSPTCTVLQDKTEDSKVRDSEPPSALIYVPLEENQPRKKREKRPKPELNCEVLPELIGLKEVLDGKKVSQLLQAKWLKQYHPSQIDRGIRKADAWAAAKGRTQTNWGLFFNNWLARDSQPRTQLGPMGGNQTTQEPKPERKSYLARMMEEEEGKNETR